jgi:hypothetical protein
MFPLAKPNYSISSCTNDDLIFHLSVQYLARISIAFAIYHGLFPRVLKKGSAKDVNKELKKDLYMAQSICTITDFN